MRRESRQLDRGAEECGGERIRREHEDCATAHVVTRAGGCIASRATTVAGGPASKRGTMTARARASTTSPLDSTALPVNIRRWCGRISHLRRRLSRSPTPRSVSRMMMAHDSEPDSAGSPRRRIDRKFASRAARLPAGLRGPEPAAAVAARHRLRGACTRHPAGAAARRAEGRLERPARSARPRANSRQQVESPAARRDDVHQGVL